MKKTIFSLAAAAIIAASCSDKTDITDLTPIDPSGKEVISFSLSEGQNNTTRVGFRDSDTRVLMRIKSDDRHASPSASKYTRAVATAKKDQIDISTDDMKKHAFSIVTMDGDQRYWDDAHGRHSLLSVYAIAIANKNDESLLPLNLMADGSGTKSETKNIAWGTTNDNSVTYKVETAKQTNDKIGEQDLVYSNNIQADETLGKDGVYRYDYTNKKYPDETGKTTHDNGRMLFYQEGMTISPLGQPTDAPGHFDKGHLVFNHALTRLTITLKEGEGFDKTSDDKDKDFKFTKAAGASAVSNVKLLGMNTTGSLDVETGKWTSVTATDIAEIAPQGTYTTAEGIFMAQMLPDYVFKDGDNTNVMTFTIDNNTYYVTQDMVYDALVATEANKTTPNGYAAATNAVGTQGEDGYVPAKAAQFKMMQGRNYNLTITVKKAGIQAITATLADWVEVKGDYSIDNSHITVSTQKVEGTGNEACREFYFYRLGQKLEQIYTDDSYITNNKATQFSGDYKTNSYATLTETASNSNIWKTNWFYESNDTAYHFRTLNKLAAGTNSSGAVDNHNITNSTETPIVSSFAMESGAQATQDYHWGAPMKTGMSTGFLKYDSEKGYENSIQQGIVAPKNNNDNTINITELHMMSNINIKLITDSVSYTESGTTKYKLGPAAVNLENAKITITRFAKTASVDMGTGKISETYTSPSGGTHTLSGDDDCAQITAPSFTGTCWWSNSKCIKASTEWYTYAVIPQALRRKDSGYTEADCVGLTIQTTDQNEYYVIKDLANIKATSVSNVRDQALNAEIKRWYPGHTYNYVIRITKKGIEAITCTVADWVTVTGKQIDITLED